VKQKDIDEEENFDALTFCARYMIERMMNVLQVFEKHEIMRGGRYESEIILKGKKKGWR
jgi:hypothetical protein